MFIHNMVKIPARQKGAVLIIGLILLVVVTLIGVTAMQKTTVDTRITGNYRSYLIAFEGTEAALRDGEGRLSRAATRPKSVEDPQNPNNPILGNPSNCNGNNQVNADWWFSCGFSWWQSQVSAGRAYEFSDPLFKVENDQNPNPMYLIEHQQLKSKKPDSLNSGSYEDPQNSKDYYRITARGSTGQNSQSDAMLQSVFAWRYRP